MSLEESQEMIDSVNKYAKNVGLVYNYATTRYTNTFYDHRIAKYAEVKGKELKISENYFSGT